MQGLRGGGVCTSVPVHLRAISAGGERWSVGAPRARSSCAQLSIGHSAQSISVDGLGLVASVLLPRRVATLDAGRWRWRREEVWGSSDAIGQPQGGGGARPSAPRGLRSLR